MADRLRAFLDRPLDPSAARAILAFASAIFLGVAVLCVFAGSDPAPTISPEVRPPAASSAAPIAPVEEVEDEAAEHRPPGRPQDPQDVEGSAAAQRAGRALRSHRALQHVPYRRGEFAITLVGARGDRAVLRVSAPDLSSACHGWRAFLRRYRDRGEAYIARFVAPDEGRRR